MRQQWAMFGLGRTIRLHVRDTQQQQQQKNVCATIAVSDLNKEQWTHIEVKRNKNNETIRIGVQYAHAGCFILIHRQRKPFSVSLYKLNFKFQIFCNSQLATQQQQPQVNFVVITFGWKIDWKTFRCWKIPIKLTFCHRNGICRCKCSNTERLAKTSG